MKVITARPFVDFKVLTNFRSKVFSNDFFYFNSGRDALLYGLKSINIHPKSSIIIPGYICNSIILPLKKNYIISKKSNLEKLIDINFTPRNLEMISVHGMSSAKMGIKRSHKEIFGIDGKSFDFKNMYCVDSSILPTSTIESPQATIMAVSNQILEELI